MRRLWPTYLVLLPQLWAQYVSISPTPDGSAAIIATSLRQAETNQPAWGKLFGVSESGVWPFLIRNRDVLPGTTNGFDLQSASISPDWRWLAVTGASACLTSTGLCQGTDERQTTLYDSTGTDRLTTRGSVLFSPNGRWMVSTRRGLLYATVLLWDLTTLESKTISSDLFNGTATSVNNAGTVIVFDSRGIRALDANGTAKTLSSTRGTALWLIDGSSFVMERDGRVLLATETTTRDLGEGGLVGVSPSGDTVILHHDGQLWNGTRQITHEPDGIRLASTSYDGSTVYYVGSSGELIRLSPDGSSRTVLIPAIAVPSVATNTLWVPRTVIVRPGDTLTASWSSPVPASFLPRVLVGSTPAQILSTSPDRFDFRVPADLTPLTAYEVTISLPEPHAIWASETTVNLATR